MADPVFRFTVLEHRVGAGLERARVSPTLSPPEAVGLSTKPVHWDWLFEPPHIRSPEGSEPQGERAFESSATLLTWASEVPSDWGLVVAGSQISVPAIQLPDHRLRYLDYEGPLSRNRGRVRIVQTGTYRLLSRSQHVFHALLSLRGTENQKSFRSGVKLERSPSDSGVVSSSWMLRVGGKT